MCRYYANSVLDHVHRANALAEWEKVVNGETVPLERALGAFDLFVLHDQHGDLLEVGLHLMGYLYLTKLHLPDLGYSGWSCSPVPCRAP